MRDLKVFGKDENSFYKHVQQLRVNQIVDKKKKISLSIWIYAIVFGFTTTIWSTIRQQNNRLSLVLHITIIYVIPNNGTKAEKLTTTTTKKQ